MIATFRNVAPSIDPTVFVAASAVVIGDAVIGAESSLWFHTVVRADVGPIRIGARTNLQDHVTVHVVGGRFGTSIGDDVRSATARSSTAACSGTACSSAWARSCSTGR